MYNKLCGCERGKTQMKQMMETNMETAAGSSVDTAAYGACNGRCRNPDAGAGGRKECGHTIR